MRKSFFERSIFLKWLRRYWVGSLLMCLAFALVACLLGMGIYVESGWEWGEVSAGRAAVFLSEPSMAMVLGVFCSGAGLVCALLCFGYLQNPRSAVMVHSLPVTRGGLFLSITAAGAVLLAGPIALGGALFGAVMLAFGWQAGGVVLVYILSMCAFALLWFSLTAFFGLLCGNSVAQGLLCGLFVMLPMVLEVILQFLLGRFWFGYMTRSGLVTDNINPISLMYRHLTQAAEAIRLERSLPVAIPLGMLAAAAVLLGLGFLLYRVRSLEKAGDVIAMRGMRPVFCFTLALLGALLLTVMFDDLRGGIGAVLLFGVLGGLLGYFAAQMLVHKTVRVLRCWKGAAAFCLVYAAFLLGLYFDVTGYGTFRLSADTVQAMAIGSNNSSYYRVQAAMTGGVLSRYDVLEDLQLEDAGGYLQRLEDGGYEAPPPDIARQILEKDATVLTGDEMQTALALQNLLAEHALELREDAREMYAGERQYIDIPLTAQMKDGRLVQRTYEFSISEDEYGELWRLWEEISRQNQNAHLQNVAGMLNSAYSVRLHYDYMGMMHRDSVVHTLNQGDWDGLMEVYRQDWEERGTLRALDYRTPVILIEMEMSDYQSETLQMDFGFENTLDWLVEKGALSAEEARRGREIYRDSLAEQGG